MLRLFPSFVFSYVRHVAAHWLDACRGAFDFSFGYSWFGGSGSCLILATTIHGHPSVRIGRPTDPPGEAHGPGAGPGDGQDAGGTAAGRRRSPEPCGSGVGPKA